MKRILFFVAIFLSTFLLPSNMMYAEKDIILLKKIHTGGARTEIPVVTAEEEDGSLILNVLHYHGYITALLIDEQGIPVICETMIVNEQTSKFINLNHVNTGNYSLRIILDNIEYIGTLSL